MTLSERISINPKVCHGKPCIRGTRIMVANILGQLEGGESWESIKIGYPEITDDDIRLVAWMAIIPETDRQ